MHLCQQRGSASLLRTRLTDDAGTWATPHSKARPCIRITVEGVPAHMKSRPQRQAHRHDVDDGGYDPALLKHLSYLFQGAHEEHGATPCGPSQQSAASWLTELWGALPPHLAIALRLPRVYRMANFVGNRKNNEACDQTVSHMQSQC